MIWIRFLNEKRFEGEKYSIMPPTFLVSHVLAKSFNWTAFASGKAKYTEFMVLWWDVDKV